MNNKELLSFLQGAEENILSYLATSDVAQYFQPDDIRNSAWSYIHRPAKRLRPAVLLMACGSVGGDEDIAVPAAAGVEIFHTWTLVHDDLIDNDALRRGFPTVHEAAAKKSSKSFGFDEIRSKEYGRNIAILTGDMQHGWATTLFIDCALKKNVDLAVVMVILKHLQSYVLANLIYGEVLDVQYGMASGIDWPNINENTIVEMLWLKTGILYEFAGLAGAMIGKNTTDFHDTHVKAIKSFTGHCGTAFQLQDDIIGILGDEKETGKPVGSDIREGKKTVIVYEALKNASSTQKKEILSVLGRRDASINQVREVTSLLQELGGVQRTQELARMYIEKAIPFLEVIEDSKYRRLLYAWADFMINRRF